MKRVMVLLVVTAVLVSMIVFMGGQGVAKQKQTFSKGQFTTHQGNSEKSPVVSCNHGKQGKGSAC